MPPHKTHTAAHHPHAHPHAHASHAHNAPSRRSNQQLVGMVVAFVTAGVVFGVGQLILPQPDWAREVPQPVSTVGPAAAASPAPTPPAPPPPPAPAPAPAATTPPPAPAAAATTPAAPATPPAAESARRAGDRARPSDKDVARAAWRKNVPDVSADANRASILIPIRGSTEGSSWRALDNPKGVLVSLPKAESMISMEFYKIRHDGFLNLWIKHDDAQGTTLRVMLGDAGSPQVEIQDDFVRVSVQKIVAAAPAN